MKDLVRALPLPNYNTMELLCKHLCKWVPPELHIHTSNVQTSPGGCCISAALWLRPRVSAGWSSTKIQTGCQSKASPSYLDLRCFGPRRSLPTWRSLWCSRVRLWNSCSENSTPFSRRFKVKNGKPFCPFQTLPENLRVRRTSLSPEESTALGSYNPISCLKLEPLIFTVWLWNR